MSVKLAKNAFITNLIFLMNYRIDILFKKISASKNPPSFKTKPEDFCLVISPVKYIVFYSLMKYIFAYKNLNFQNKSKSNNYSSVPYASISHIHGKAFVSEHPVTSTFK